MRIIPALAAMVAALFKPRKKIKRVEIGAAPDLPAPRISRGELRRRRRTRIARSFTRALAHAVMRDPDVSAEPLARRKWRNERKRARRAGR